MGPLTIVQHFVEEALRDAFGRHGTSPKEQDVLIDWDSDAVHIARRPIGYEWKDAKSKSRLHLHPIQRSFKIDAQPKKIIRDVEIFVELMMALKTREEVILRHGADRFQVPAWSIAIEPCALHLLKTGGWSDEEMLRLYKTESGHLTVGDLGHTIGAGLPEREIEGRRIGAPVMHIKGGILHVSIDLSGNATYKGGASPHLILPMPPLPDSLMIAMKGRSISDVIDSPIFSDCSAKISAAKRNRDDDGKYVRISLERKLVPMADAPSGMDRSWLRQIGCR